MRRDVYRPGLFVFAIVLLSGVLLTGGTVYSGTEPAKPKADIQQQTHANSSSSGKEDEIQEFIGDGQGNIPMRWIPNQRVLPGAPSTTISLDDAIERFKKEGAFGPENSFDLSRLKISIVSKVKPELVIPVIHDDLVVLDWKSQESAKGDVVIGLKYEDMPAVFLSFNAEVWRPNYIWMIAVVIGGLGLFLFGMRNMSEGLQMIAGAGLRRLIAVFTENRFLAVGIGILATVVVQSSSVTTVMVVGFINSQIMTLAQGIGVIIGANIGTTVTGWILALKIGDFGLPILGISTFFYIFAKTDRVRYISMSVMGLGFLFFGLKTMESGFSQLVELPEFSMWLKSFAANSYLGVLKCIGIGCFLTMIVQSSAATLGITISLASIGAIDFSTSAALVLGENIGTTITALLVSIGTSTNAKRAAYFHSLFNCIGVTWASIIFLPILLPIVTSVAHVQHGHNVAAGIALTHSLFNITNALLFIPFTRVFARLLTWMVPGTQKHIEPKLSLTSLGIRHMETPIIAIERSRVEILRMANGCWEISDWLHAVTEDNYSDERMVDEIFRQEAILDNMQDEIITFLAEILAKTHSAEIAATAREQLRLADELETLSDYYVSILKSNLKLKEAGQTLPAAEKEDFANLYADLAEQFLTIRNTYAKDENVNEMLQEIYSRRSSFTSRVKEMRDRFMKKIANEHYTPQVIIAVSSQLTYYRRLREHLQNIAEAMKHV